MASMKAYAGSLNCGKGGAMESYVCTTWSSCVSEPYRCVAQASGLYMTRHDGTLAGSPLKQQHLSAGFGWRSELRAVQLGSTAIETEFLFEHVKQLINLIGHQPGAAHPHTEFGVVQLA